MSRALVRRASSTAAAVISLGAALAVFAPTALASPYCGGWLAGGGQCNGAARNLTGVSGVGNQHGVCVWADNLGRMCSGGAGAGAGINYGSYAVRIPRISNSGATPNLVQGNTY